MTCSKCKKQPAGEDYKQCDACRLRARAYMQKHMREQRTHYNARMRAYMSRIGKAQREIEQELGQ